MRAWLLIAALCLAGCLAKDAVHPQLNSPDQDIDVGGGRDTTVYQLAGSGWVVVVLVLGWAWLSNRRRTKNECGVAKAIWKMGEGKQRDRLLTNIARDVPHQRQWNRSIRKFQVKRTGHTQGD